MLITGRESAKLHAQGLDCPTPVWFGTMEQVAVADLFQVPFYTVQVREGHRELMVNKLGAGTEGAIVQLLINEHIMGIYRSPSVADAGPKRKPDLLRAPAAKATGQVEMTGGRLTLNAPRTAAPAAAVPSKADARSAKEVGKDPVEGLYEVEKIVEQASDAQGADIYKVRWVGAQASADRWLRYEDLQQCRNVLETWARRHDRGGDDDYKPGAEASPTPSSGGSARTKVAHRTGTVPSWARRRSRII